MGDHARHFLNSEGRGTVSVLNDEVIVVGSWETIGPEPTLGIGCISSRTRFSWFDPLDPLSDSPTRWMFRRNCSTKSSATSPQATVNRSAVARSSRNRGSTLAGDAFSKKSTCQEPSIMSRGGTTSRQRTPGVITIRPFVDMLYRRDSRLTSSVTTHPHYASSNAQPFVREAPYRSFGLKHLRHFNTHSCTST